MKKVFLVLAFLVTNVSFSFAIDIQDPAWDKYITAQKKLQVAMHHMARREFPVLKPVIKESQELQLMSADQKTLRFQYINGLNPSRIVRDQGFEAFVNYTWTTTDHEQLKEANSEYRKLSEKIYKLAEKLSADPKYKMLQENMQTIKNKGEYLEILARFRFVKEEVEEILKFGGSGDLASDWTRTI